MAVSLQPGARTDNASGHRQEAALSECQAKPPTSIHQALIPSDTGTAGHPGLHQAFQPVKRCTLACETLQNQAWA